MRKIRILFENRILEYLIYYTNKIIFDFFSVPPRNIRRREGGYRLGIREKVSVKILVFY